ncbi:MAG: PAS domain S-box protein [Bdellovibrionales bacterium]|nr:PAS domain S-box protein [Bdellovibrionales bacterium]
MKTKEIPNIISPSAKSCKINFTVIYLGIFVCLAVWQLSHVFKLEFIYNSKNIFPLSNILCPLILLVTFLLERLVSLKANITNYNSKFLKTSKILEETSNEINNINTKLKNRELELVQQRKAALNIAADAKKALEQAEQANITANEQRKAFQAVVNSSPNGLLGVSRDGKIELANKTLEKMFGYTNEELIGQSVEILIPMEFHHKHKGFVDGFFQSPDARPMGEGRDLLGQRKDQTTFPVEIGLQPLAGKNSLSVIAAITDITQRKKYEEDLKHSNEELERFAYVASHDLQEPLRMVGSFASILQEEYSGKFDENGQKYLDFMIDGAKRMQTLVQDLLAYSRTSSREINQGKIDGNKLLEQVLKNLSVIIQESNAKISHDPLPNFIGDESLLFLVFQNLISNAIKYMSPDKTPEIHINAVNNYNKCTISIKDNGIGIPKEAYNRIFIIFQRLHGRQEYSGTGIGLAICKKIIERHGEKIWLESEEGRGTTFYFTLKTIQ